MHHGMLSAARTCCMRAMSVCRCVAASGSSSLCCVTAALLQPPTLPPRNSWPVVCTYHDTVSLRHRIGHPAAAGASSSMRVDLVYDSADCSPDMLWTLACALLPVLQN